MKKISLFLSICVLLILSCSAPEESKTESEDSMGSDTNDNSTPLGELIVALHKDKLEFSPNPIALPSFPEMVVVFEEVLSQYECKLLLFDKDMPSLAFPVIELSL